MATNVIDSNHLDDILKKLHGYRFYTWQFALKFREKYPKEWMVLVNKYGKGGKGTGNCYSPYVYIGNYLGRQFKHARKYVSAQSGWGSPVMSLWNKNGKKLNIGEIDEILCDASNLKEDRTLSSTERKALIDSRLGQGMFRDAVVNYWKACALTRYQRVDLLKAGHIKPWRECSNRERLNKFNGILLTPNFHEVFDKGLISFTNNGKILISCDLSEADKAHLGITDKMHIKISDEHKKYFDFHRKRIFIR